MFIANIFILLININIYQIIDIEKLKKDPKLIEFKKINNEIKEGIISKKYKLPPNTAIIQKELANNPSKELLKKRYKESGMKNAEEYLDKMYLQSTLMTDFLKKHPELTKLEQQKRTQILMKLLMD